MRVTARPTMPSFEIKGRRVVMSNGLAVPRPTGAARGTPVRDKRIDTVADAIDGPGVLAAGSRLFQRASPADMIAAMGNGLLHGAAQGDELTFSAREEESPSEVGDVLSIHPGEAFR